MPGQRPVEVIDDLNLGQPNCPFPILCALQVWTPGDDSALASMIEASLKAFVSTDLGTDGKQVNHTKNFGSRLSSAKKPLSPVRKYFAFLESFSETKGLAETQAQATQANIAGRSAREIETPSDFPAHVHKTLYNVLMKKHAQCCCGSSVTLVGAIPRHQGRLKLKETVQILEDNVVFDTVFSRSPRNNSARRTEWQQLQFQVPV